MTRTLRRAIAAAALGATALALPAVPTPAVAGGFTCDATHPNNEFRWQIKSLSDADRETVNFEPIHTQVARLRSFARPDVEVRDSTPRIGPREKHTYHVSARALQGKIERDGDVILIVAIPGHLRRTIVFEFANPRCVTERFKRHQMGVARRGVLRRCGPLDSGFTPLRGRLGVTGVGFWDRNSSETGAAPNAFQLWPVLHITGRCHQR